jgi:hypothetical protein
MKLSLIEYMKFALLIGINYRKSPAELRGCINDVIVMKRYLMEKRGYLPENIMVLTEDEPNKPTGMNILQQLGKLILRAQTGGAKEIWLHYSGHGSSTRDLDGDESDGLDETIVPLDYLKCGMIRDDQLNDYLEHVPAGCKMYCIFDCCHSGTILDLMYQYKGGIENSIENKGAHLKGNIVMISGCADKETSADAKINGGWSGAMTAAYISCIADDIECDDLLLKMRDYIKRNGYKQVPQMCSSRPIGDKLKW